MYVWTANLFAAEREARFCFQTTKDSSITLTIKRNIDIELSLIEIKNYIVCEDKWHPQIDLDIAYEVVFPEEWNCVTLVPVWSIMTCEELQKFFSDEKNKALG